MSNKCLCTTGPLITQYFSHLTQCRSNDDWVVVDELVTKRTLFSKIKRFKLLAHLLSTRPSFGWNPTPSIVMDMSSYTLYCGGHVVICKMFTRLNWISAQKALSIASARLQGRRGKCQNISQNSSSDIHCLASLCQNSART